MKVVKKNVYYCDFCSKKGLRSLKIHERHCTANPDRVCRLCGRESIREIIEKYKKYFRIIEIPDEEQDEGIPYETGSIKVEYLKDFTLDDIRNELDYNCPNCLLAIIRCAGLNRWYFGTKFKFDYRKELKEWWSF